MSVEHQTALNDFVAACARIPADHTNRQELLNIISRFSGSSNSTPFRPLTAEEADRIEDILTDFPEIVDTISNAAWQYNERIMNKIRTVPIVENGKYTYPDEDGYYNLSIGPIHGIEAAMLFQIDQSSNRAPAGRGFSLESARIRNSRSCPWESRHIRFFMDSRNSDTDARRNRLIGQFNLLNAATGMELTMMGRGPKIGRRTRYVVRRALWTILLLHAVRIKIKNDGDTPGSATVGSMLLPYLRYSSSYIDNPILTTIFGDINTDKTLQHETCHILGMIHEHQRYDRDTYITITKGGTGRQFDKIPQHNGNIFTGGTSTTLDTPYDYNSIMHYQTLTWADGMWNEYSIINPIHAIRGGQNTRLNLALYGHTNGNTWLSPWDIYSIKRMYNIVDNPRPIYTPGTDLSYSNIYIMDSGGTQFPDTRIYPMGTSVTTFPAPDFLKPGYVFTGWEVFLNGTNTVVPAGGTFLMPANDVYLTAKWDPSVERTIFYKPTEDPQWNWYVMHKIGGEDFNYEVFPGEQLTREGEWMVWHKTTIQGDITLLFTSALGSMDMCQYTVASNTAWLHDWTIYYSQPY